jgi:hypothetical protein
MSNLEVLQEAGVAVDDLSDEQKTVFTDLSADELGLLIGIKARLDEEVDGDVEAHTVVVAGGVLF